MFAADPAAVGSGGAGGQQRRDPGGQGRGRGSGGDALHQRHHEDVRWLRGQSGLATGDAHVRHRGTGYGTAVWQTPVNGVNVEFGTRGRGGGRLVSSQNHKKRVVVLRYFQNHHPPSENVVYVWHMYGV